MDSICYSMLGLHSQLDHPKISGWHLKWIKQRAPELKAASLLETPLGTMLALSSEECLYGLYFSDQPIFKIIKHLSLIPNITIHSETIPPIKSIQQELKRYFSGHLKRFETPIQLCGSTFQKRAWKALMEVPYGVTRSYAEQAIAIGAPKSYRAVANANHANPIAIVVPCHRIIRGNGELSGYAGGKARKHWLILNEKNRLLSKPND